MRRANVFVDEGPLIIRLSNVCCSFLLQLVSSFQIEAMARQQEGQQAKNKLSSVRKMIAKLLKSINEVRMKFSLLIHTSGSTVTATLE